MLALWYAMTCCPNQQHAIQEQTASTHLLTIWQTPSQHDKLHDSEEGGRALCNKRLWICHSGSCCVAGAW